MAKKIEKKANINEIKCGDCIHSIPDMSNLSFHDKKPILCTCKFEKNSLLIGSINLRCINAKIKQLTK